MNSSRTQLWYLIGTLSVGGAERTLVDLANNLNSSRYEITIWTISKPGPLTSEVDDHVTIRSLDATSKTDILVPIQFIAALRRENPDILQSFLFYDNTLATLAGLFSPNTTVITGVRAVPNTPSTIRTAVRHITHRLADEIVSNSKAGVDFITEHSVKSDAVSVIHNGRDLEEYKNGTATPAFRKSLHIPSDAPVVGTVGRLIRRKGHYDLLEAWPLVLNEHPNAHLVIVGDGPERNGLENRSRELDVWNSVHLLGTRDDIPALLDLMDVFVFPSHFEGLPGALLEAMAAELPIVATPVDGNAELIIDEENGLHVPVADSQSLGNQIAQLLSDTEYGYRLGQSAGRVAHEEFTLNQMIKSFVQLYDKNITTRSPN